METLLIKPKQVRLLLSLANGGRKLPLCKIAIKINITISHALKLSSEFIEEGYITKTKNGKNNVYELTKKGKDVILCLLELRKAMYL